MEKTIPTKTFKAGTIQVSLWEHDGEGDKKLQSFTFQKSYKDDSGEWKHSQSLFTSDIPKLILALQQAYKETMLKA
jgi:hypothetical protein